ncbi:MAG: phosphoribosyltransferase [Chloroflexi bacterium]|nr:phosphoribosyltransferase [Chloroflexota bacterium]
MILQDRTEGGKLLAEHLAGYRNQRDVLILALPRGGVPVAWEVTQHLHAPLDIFLVRKLGAPGHGELAIGAVATGGVRVLNNWLISMLGVTDAELEAITDRELAELERRQRLYRGDRPLPEIGGRTILLIDDGLATGATMRAAVLAIQQKEPARLVVGVPIASSESCDAFRDEVDQVICAVTPEPFHAVGLWYRNFEQVSDEEVQDLLARSRGDPFTQV